jgi:CRISPR-associated protein Cas2
MIVITLTDCPPSLRGDLTKWLQEVNTGVYVGKVSARVRDEIWKRVRDNIKSGRATMVFSTNNEQGMDFKVHNTSWEPIDFDGLKLMLRPSPARVQKLGKLRLGYSKASRFRKAKRLPDRKRRQLLPETYLVVDVETTGLSPMQHEIIEIGAIKVLEGQVEGEFHALVNIQKSIPPHIRKLTGISDEMLEREGKQLAEVLPLFLAFAGDLPMVSHNADFDLGFLRSGCESCGLPLFSNQRIDTLALSRQVVDGVADYRLATLLGYFKIEATGIHRSAKDCLTTKQLYEKLIELYLEER